MKNLAKTCILLSAILAASTLAAKGPAWRQATQAELAAVLPSRAPVISEHIETEMRTASGIVDSQGHFIAGVVLITAGYSADGKYSHFLVVQAPIEIGGVQLTPGNYIFGWTRSTNGDSLNVHFNDAATGNQLGTADAHWIEGTTRIESLHIWPPQEKSIIQIGRFGIPYKFIH
ncbi:MAG TPA: hypothetical protein VME23_19590 [Terracidiphilus sp.]|jgi:hypothetical protein|nr:hypothetical protein [Terracidiphilus sp.]